jgi:beta,beta-carotene 9',10'-dioxygenase
MTWGLETETVTRPGYLAGFETLESEVALDSLPVEGTIPEWLEGTLVRNGPGKFEAGETPLRHWFDGLAMLHRFSFDRGRVSYANRFLRTEAYRAALRGDLSFCEFATYPSRSLLKRAALMLKPEFSDNCSFGVARLGEELIAVTETPVSIAFDPETLETGEHAYSPPGQHVTAHSHRDRETGELLGLATHFGPRSKYRVFAQKDRASQRILAEIPAREPSYMHSFGLSERHFVITACPFVVNPLQLGLGGRPFIENFRWEPERGTKFFVVDRESGEHRAFETDAFFAFHHVNAFERGADLVVDLIVYDDPGMIDALYLDQLRSGPPPGAVHGRLARFRIDFERGGVVEEEELCSEMFELPRIDEGWHGGRSYRYVYGAGIDTDTGGEPSDFPDQLLKVDIETGGVTTWHEPAAYPGEPVFVPSPRLGRAEDEGVLLSVVLDVRGADSYLLVLDARTFEELARARTPHAIPFGFHGQYFA